MLVYQGGSSGGTRNLKSLSKLATQMVETPKTSSPNGSMDGETKSRSWLSNKPMRGLRGLGKIVDVAVGRALSIAVVADMRILCISHLTLTSRGISARRP